MSFPRKASNRPRSIVAVALALLFVGVQHARAEQREFSLDLWDWTQPCRDLDTYRAWVKDLKSIGLTRVEISAPWNVLEPEPGKIDVSFVTDRLKIAKENGLGLRVRINSFYAGATPAWYHGDTWKDIDGKDPVGTPLPVSISDDRFWEYYGPVCTALASACKGEDVFFSPFIAVHAELKYADWWSYDASTLKLWRDAISITPRPAWLVDVAGDAALPNVPPVPQSTKGTPDNSPTSRAWIAFREETWRQAIQRFNVAIHAGDPKAKTSAPLGESFRRESAKFSNLDYWGLSRGMKQIVHSYDFYWHAKDEDWIAAAAVASFRGISGIDNIAFEFDGPGLVQTLGYDVPRQVRMATAAMSQGAGLKCANYSGDPTLPSEWPVLVDFGKLAATAEPMVEPEASNTILLFVSKWTTYCYRENSEWLHDAQFGAWKMLKDHGYTVRFICEDNLDEHLSAYRGMYVAFSPPELLPTTARAKLATLCSSIPTILELSHAPSAAPAKSQALAAIRPGSTPLTLDVPLAWHWLRGNHDQSDARFSSLAASVWK